MSQITNYLNALIDSPIAVKDMRSAIREIKSSFLIPFMLICISGIAVSYLSDLCSSNGTINYLINNACCSSEYLMVITCTITVLLALICPTLTAGLIAEEREKHSLALLATSRLQTWEIIAGKFLFALLYTIMLIAVTAPVCGLLFLAGGMTLSSFCIAYGLIFLAGFLFCLTGLWMSARDTNTRLAQVQTYMLIFPAIIIILPLGGGFFYSLINNRLDMISQDEISICAISLLCAAYYIYAIFLKCVNYISPSTERAQKLRWAFYIWFSSASLLYVARLFSDPSYYSSFWYLWGISALTATTCFLNTPLENTPWALAKEFKHALIIATGGGVIGLLAGLYNSGLSSPQHWLSWLMIVSGLFALTSLIVMLKSFWGQERYKLVVFTLLGLGVAVISVIAFKSITDTIDDLEYICPLIQLSSLWEQKNFYLWNLENFTSSALLFLMGLACLFVANIRRKRLLSLSLASNNPTSSEAEENN